MKIKFWKMHGARNDFILIDDREKFFPAHDSAFIRDLCARRSGIGADGLVLIQPSARAAFFMRFYNPDGGEAGMCGNGARCVARLAYELGIAGAQMKFETAAGLIDAEVAAGAVHIGLTDPCDWILSESLEIDGDELTFGFVNTGVPHVVVRTAHVRDINIRAAGAAIRQHRRFAPVGTNVNFIELLAGGALAVRTYERGVEDETLACGTGIAASALIAAKNGWVSLPVNIHTAGGDVLSVNAELTAADTRGVSLTGPAEHVYEGIIQYKERS